MNNIFMLLIELILWCGGGYLLYTVGGWALFFSMWILFTAFNLQLARQQKEIQCKQHMEKSDTPASKKIPKKRIKHVD